MQYEIARRRVVVVGEKLFLNWLMTGYMQHAAYHVPISDIQFFQANDLHLKLLLPHGELFHDPERPR